VLNADDLASAQRVRARHFGSAPYGATTLTGGDGSRQPSATGLDGARFLGRHLA